MTFNSTKKGFTLIELLVVISIIGLLSSIVLASLSVARAKGRDAKRIEDLHQIQTALELFRNDTGAYPGACSGSDRAATVILDNGVDGDNGFKCPLSGVYLYNAPYTALVPTYIPAIPNDPINVAPYGYYYLWQFKKADSCPDSVLSHGLVQDSSWNTLACWTGNSTDYILMTRLETKGLPFNNIPLFGPNTPAPGLNYIVGTN